MRETSHMYSVWEGIQSIISLKRHSYTVTCEKPHTCTVCGKGFSTLSDLRTHSYTVTCKKPHTCTVCGKGFSTLSDLRTHSYTVTCEKPHTCTVCGKGFSQSSALRDTPTATEVRCLTHLECVESERDAASNKHYNKVLSNTQVANTNHVLYSGSPR